MNVRALRRALRDELPAIPLIGAADARWSTISSALDLYTRPNGDLVDVLLEAASEAKLLSLDELVSRCGSQDAEWVKLWPGEHYRLLAALTQTHGPAVVVEVGTFHGQGALALAAGSPEAKVITYDIVPWRDFPDTALRETDFTSGRIEQRIGDLGDPAYLAAELSTLLSADIIFIDGPKDGVWEQRSLLSILGRLTDRRRLVVLDDIRLMPMVQLWRDIPMSKLDATSLGHWSGTGLVHTA